MERRAKYIGQILHFHSISIQSTFEGLKDTPPPTYLPALGGHFQKQEKAQDVEGSQEESDLRFLNGSTLLAAGEKGGGGGVLYISACTAGQILLEKSDSD